MPRWSGSRKTWMAGSVIIQFEMAFCSPRTLSCESKTNASPRIRRRACLGKPRRMDSDIWQLVVSIQVDRVMVGEIKMDLKWGFLGVLRTHVVVTSVCTTGCLHTSCRTHISLVQSLEQVILIHFSRVCTHARLKDVKKVCAVRKSRLSISPSPFWCFTHLLRCFLIASLTPRVSLSYSRNSCQVCLDPKARVRCTSETVRMTLATWPTCRTPQVMSPTSLTRWFLRMMTRRPSTIQTTTVSVTSQKQHKRTLDGSVFLQCGRVHTQPNTLKSGDRNLLKKKVWKTGQRKQRRGSLATKKQDNESWQRQAIGNKGSVVAKNERVCWYREDLNA